MGDMRPKIQYQLSLAFMTEGRGETPDAGREGTESPTAKREPENPATGESLMEEVCERENLEDAWHRVRSNKGSPGVDGRTIDETRDYLREHWKNGRTLVRTCALGVSHFHAAVAAGVGSAYSRMARHVAVQQAYPTLSSTDRPSSIGDTADRLTRSNRRGT